MKNWIRDRFQQFEERLIAIDDVHSVTYAEFIQKIDSWHAIICSLGIKSGDRVGLIADYHISAIALLQALLDMACIIVPLSEDDRNTFDERLQIACVNKLISFRKGTNIDEKSVGCQSIGVASETPHELMMPLLNEKKAGLVIFTSGSTGKGKAVLLEYDRMICRFRNKTGKSFRTLLFLKLDHIGGLNTLFSVIFNGGAVVTSKSRQIKEICRSIEKHGVELLPTTPSFLTMLLMSNMHREYDLSSLKIISYGTEVMPNSTLAGINKIFPDVELKQTYGLSELGILPTRSMSSESKWMKIGGSGFEVKVRNEILWIKSDQAMLGYLNAENPFDDDGWYNTGDKVEVSGDYFRILGRESEIINIAGEKVYPAEIESYLLTLDNVKDVVVRGKRSPIIGQIVWAEFVLKKYEDVAIFKKRIAAKCLEFLPPFKVPRLITIANNDSVVGTRFKKIRKC